MEPPPTAPASGVAEASGGGDGAGNVDGLDADAMQRLVDEAQAEAGSEANEQNGEHDFEEDGEQMDLSGSAGKDSEAGTLERVELVSFMSHEHCELKLGPNVNFIIGPNGSGKSAVLVAISIALGGRANFTERASRVGDLVQHGQATARITLDLRNRGADAWRADEFGDTIRLVTTVSRAANTRSYKLHAARDGFRGVVSRSARDVQAMVEHFNIQINNPCCILMQDTARQFLTSAQPGQLYTFFLKATLLEQLRVDMEHVFKNLQSIRMLLTQKQQLMPEMQEKLAEIEREWTEIRGVVQLEGQVRLLKDQLAWAYVRDAERELTKQREEGVRAVEMSSKAAEETERRAKEHEEVERQLKAQTEPAERLTTLQNQLIEEKMTAERAKAEQQRRLQQEQSRVDDCRKRLANVDKRRTRLEAQLEEERRREATAAAQADSEQRRRREEQAKRRQEIADLESTARDAQRQLEEVEQELERHGGEMRDSEQRRDTAAQRLRAIEQRRNALASGKRDANARYGPWVPDMIATIDREHQKQPFDRKPIGPLGRFVEMKENQAPWTNAVESHIKSQIHLWLCHSARDEARLRQLFQQKRQWLRVVTMPFAEQVHDVASNEPARNMPTIFRVLRMVEGSGAAGVVAMNALVDLVSIETTVLCQTRHEAEDLVASNPRNVSLAVDINGNSFSHRRGTHQTQFRNYKAEFLGVNAAELLRQTEAELETQRKHVVEANQRNDELSRRKSGLDRRKDDARKRSKQAQNRRSALEQEQQEQERTEKAAQEASTGLADIGRSLADVEKERSECVKRLSEAEASVRVREAELQPLREATEKMKQRLKQHGEELEQAQKEAERLAQRLQRVATALARAQRDRATATERQRQLAESVLELEQRLQRTSDSARQLAPVRPAELDPRSVSEIDKAIRAKEQRIAREQEGRRCSTAEVKEQLVQARTVVKHVTQLLKLLEAFRKQLLQSGAARMKLHKKLLLQAAHNTNRFFSMYLQLKDYSGQIVIDHEKRTLTVQVHTESAHMPANERPDDSATGRRDTRTLSGGERSYSTVALILSLWTAAVESPLRALDEFDVFMDSVNRKISIELIMAAARREQHRQFIFITPQDQSQLPAGQAIVRVHKLQPPSRNAGRGGVQARLTLAPAPAPAAAAEEGDGGAE